MNLTGLSIIGDRSGARGGITFTGINPADGLAGPVEFHSASVADVATAAKLAGKAFAVYSQWSGRQRLALSNRIAELLEASVAEIVVRASLETALPVARLQGELMRTCFQLRQYGQAAASGLCAGAA